MVKMVPIDPKWHAGKALRQAAGYGFVSTQALAPLTAAEFPAAASSMPIAFLQNTPGHYNAVVVMSPIQGRNFFVSPTGQWLGNYVPTALRSYPFRLGTAEGSSTVRLWIDEDAGAVVDAEESPTTRFFQEDGSPSPAVKGTLEFLQKIEEDRAVTAIGVAALSEAGVIRPWPLTVTIGKQQVTATGLHGINEAALNALDEHTFIKLRKTSALGLAYAQLVSVHTVGLFSSLDTIQHQMAQRAKPLPETSKLFSDDDDGTIKFN